MFKAILSFSLILSCLVTHGAECTYTPAPNLWDDSLSSIETRIAKLIKADGSEVTFIGERHQDFEEAQGAYSFVTNSDETLEEFTNTITNGLAGKNVEKVVIGHLRQNIAYMKKRFRSGDVKFLGIEGPHEVISTDISYYEEVTAELLKSFEKKGFKNQSMIDDILSIVMDGYWVVMKSEPEIMKNVEVVGIDNFRSSDEYKDLDPQIFALGEKVTDVIDEKASSEDAVKLKNLAEVIFKKSFLNFDTDLTEKDIQESLSLFPDYVAPSLRDLLELIAEERKINRKRDEYMANDILMQEGNGIVILGRAHLETLELQFKRLCQ